MTGTLRRPWTRRPSPRRAAWYQSPDGTRASIEWMLANTRNPDNHLRLPPGGVASLPTVFLQCELVITMARGSNGKVFHVRCRCMVGTRFEPTRSFYAYDPIGQAGSAAEAVAMWREHRDGKSQLEAAS